MSCSEVTPNHFSLKPSRVHLRVPSSHAVSSHIQVTIIIIIHVTRYVTAEETQVSFIYKFLITSLTQQMRLIDFTNNILRDATTQICRTI